MVMMEMFMRWTTFLARLCFRKVTSEGLRRASPLRDNRKETHTTLKLVEDIPRALEYFL
jgi:hypothetical protein